MEIIDFQEKHLDAVEKIEKESHIKPWKREMFLSSLLNDTVSFKVILEDNEVAGYCLYSIVASECEILNVVVSKKHRRKSFAKKMLQYVEIKAKEKDVKNIFLEVREKNSPAINLYLSQGFQYNGQRLKYYGDENAQLLRKKI